MKALISNGYLKLYHWTDVRNLPSIREHGLLSLRELKRRGIAPPAPGGNEQSHLLDENSEYELDKYVHLAFTNQHPMEYSARQKGHVGATHYISVNKQVVTQDGILFCNDVANKTGIAPIPLADAYRNGELAIWMRWNDYGDASVQARVQHAKRFELLVPTHIALTHLANIP